MDALGTDVHFMRYVAIIIVFPAARGTLAARRDGIMFYWRRLRSPRFRRRRFGRGWFRRQIAR
jgi:hypothetical protein